MNVSDNIKFFQIFEKTVINDFIREKIRFERNNFKNNNKIYYNSNITMINYPFLKKKSFDIKINQTPDHEIFLSINKR